ncbi:MAG TPA: oxygen-dependent coproporphyrinogen oxidase [Actinobacteria bacterium]|nr:oxygen-dependent coproporphyrinogen oxidase [Actinomycetota bacterium]
MKPDRDEVARFYAELQSSLCDAFAALDGTARFGVDRWERPGGGGGVTRVLVGDGPLEKAAVNVSTVWGDVPPRLSDALASRASTFFATGISMIFHPRNPHAPTMHANLRYFETDRGDAWFGGGIDLTPYYLYEEDVRGFHRALREVCDAHRVADYPAWKAACDRYFFLPHRGEARGVGGIFYDHLTERLVEVDRFQRDLGSRIFELYGPILERRMTTPYDAAQERWHLRRRGRYAEFNLAVDRGTRFGLETGARAESVLASLPPRVRWDYAPRVEPGTPEHALVEVLRRPRDWA